MNKLTRMPQAAVPAQAPQSGMWQWDGQQWTCGCDGDGGQWPGCPPSSWPPPGCPPWWSGANSPPWYPGANGGVSFGSTPPTNPIRGHMWWDGNAMWLFDGAAWVDFGIGGASTGGGGAATGTTPPANPGNGALWFNGSIMYVWDGNAWVPTSQTKSYVQPTAPPSPNPGDTWFDGSVMRIWSGSAWALVGPGATVGPVATTTIVFAMAEPTPINIGSNVWTILPFTAHPLVDLQSAYDPVSQRFTPKVAGMYQFYIRSLLGGGGSNWFALSLLKNDTGTYVGNTDNNIAICMETTSAAGGWFWMSASGIAQMNGSTDFVRLFGFATVSPIQGAGNNAMFTAVLMP